MTIMQRDGSNVPTRADKNILALSRLVVRSIYDMALLERQIGGIWLYNSYHANYKG